MTATQSTATQLTATTGLLVGVTGYARSGKDTFGQALVSTAGFKRFAFADAIKSELAEFLVIGLDEIERRKDEFRPALDALGTARRKEDERYWMRKVVEAVGNHRAAGGHAVVTDVRLPVEGDEIKRRGGIMVRMILMGQEPRIDLETERSVDLVRVDKTYRCPPGVCHVQRCAGDILIELTKARHGLCPRGGCDD